MVGKKQGDIRFQSVSSTGEMQGEIYIPAEALENEGINHLFIIIILLLVSK